MTNLESDMSPAPPARRLVIGAAQFGMPYGATNVRGQVPLQEVAEILARAHDAKIRLIDTAAGYGTSEAVLGNVLPDFPSIGVITKLPAFSGLVISAEDVKAMRDTVLRSLDLLRRTKLDGLLVHHGADLLKPGGEQVVDLLESLKRERIVDRVGISIYDAEEIDGILKIFRPDTVQIPINLFDQRLVESGHIKSLHAAGIEIHARSIFLQGVLLTDVAGLPDYFHRFVEQFGRYSRFLDENEMTRLAACLGFMIEQSGADCILVGVTKASELDQILAALPRGPVLPPMRKLASEDLALIDPRKWRLASSGISQQ